MCAGDTPSFSQKPSCWNSPRVKAEIPLATIHALQTHLNHLNSALERFDHEPDRLHHDTACHHAVEAQKILECIAL
jgi:hypothetical protein